MDRREKVVKALEWCPKNHGCDGCPYYIKGLDDDGYDSECVNELMRDALEVLAEYDDFCRFVTAEMLDEKNECGTCGAGEVFCRKLVKLGYMKLEDDVYSEVERG